MYVCVCRLDTALDLELLATERHTGRYFFEEARGLADAAGIDYKVGCHRGTRIDPHMFYTYSTTVYIPWIAPIPGTHSA